VLNSVKFAVLLVFLGPVIGLRVDMFFPSNVYVADELVLPAASPHSASELARMTRADHQDVRVDAYKGSLSFSATGSPDDAYRAVNLANKAVIVANNGKIKARIFGTTPRVPSGRYALIGLLAGIGAAIGFLVPPKRRVTGVL